MQHLLQLQFGRLQTGCDLHIQGSQEGTATVWTLCCSVLGPQVRLSHPGGGVPREVLSSDPAAVPLCAVLPGSSICGLGGVLWGQKWLLQPRHLPNPYSLLFSLTSAPFFVYFHKVIHVAVQPNLLAPDSVYLRHHISSTDTNRWLHWAGEGRWWECLTSLTGQHTSMFIPLYFLCGNLFFVHGGAVDFI